MTLLSSAQLKVLGRLTEVWKGKRFCLIGAGALHSHRPDYFRETKDLDITVSVSVDEVGSAMQGLPEFVRHKTKEHEWMGPSGVRLDIIPAGPTLLAAGGLVWPESGHHMSLVGFRLALERGAPKRMGPGLTVPVASLDVIVLLKMVAYLDRPGERERDLQDIAYVLENYLSPIDPRRGDDAAYDAQIDFYHESAFVLGQDLGSIMNPLEHEVVQRFLGKLRTAPGPAPMLITMARLGPRRWNGDEDTALGIVDAFAIGLNYRQDARS